MVALAPAQSATGLDEAERLRQFHEVCRRDLVQLAGVHTSWFARNALQIGMRGQLRRFADSMAHFNERLDSHGLAHAAVDICARYNGTVDSRGAQSIPADGPLLLASNHPGMFDTLAIYATLPRQDIRAIARPQPLLNLLSSLAPNLLLLPDEGPGRSGSLREVLRVLREGTPLLIFPAGHLEPEPVLIGRHGPGDDFPTEPFQPWSAGIGTMVRMAARQGIPLKVVPTSIVGVLSLSTWNWFGPLIRRRPTLRRREDLVAVLQVAFPSFGPTTIRVTYGEPIDAAELAAEEPSPEAITARVQGIVRQQIAAARNDLLVV
ncbi:MAG: 1-acyl-sn-glycerol-3-phosphate acyltransferase [Chloroflexi bacterium]|nr:1-acyl-sn-glycerol-3-phosphate acyltransferase [Chloroflexota bacterium]